MKVSIEKQVFESQKIIAEELAKGNLEKTWTLLEKTEKLLKNLENPEKLQNCLKSLYPLYGKYYIASENYTKAVTYLEETLNFPGLSKPDTLEIFLNLCNLLNLTHNYQKLLIKSSQALNFINSTDPSAALVHYYIGLAHQNLQNFPLAEKCFKESLSLANQSLGYNHPTTSLVTQKYLKFLKIVQNTKLPLGGRKTRESRVSTSFDSEGNSRIYCSGSKQENKGFLPRLRNGNVEFDLRPIIPTGFVRTPKAGSIIEDKYEDRMTPVKGRTPQTSCRLRVRRLSAEMIERNEEIKGKNEEFKRKNEEFKRKNEEIKGKNEELKGKNEETKGKHEDLIRNNQDLVRKTADNKRKSGLGRGILVETKKNTEKNNINQIIMIQKHIKGWIQRRKYARTKREALKGRTEKVITELNDLKAQILILKTVEHESKVIYKLEYTKKDVIERVSKYILRIQRYFRGYLQRKKWQRVKNSVLKIQSCVKMYLVKVLFQKILLAIRFIQESWRKYKKVRVGKPVI